MQIKFLTLYHNFSNEEHSFAEAQRDLLFMWQNAVRNQILILARARKIIIS